MAKKTFLKTKQCIKALRLYTLKIPFVFLMAAAGFIFEFLITFPHIVMVKIDERRSAKHQRK